MLLDNQLIKSKRVTKTYRVKDSMKKGNWKNAFKLAKTFKLGITIEQQEVIKRAYECILYPRFFTQIGINVSEAINDGKKTLFSIYPDYNE